jgi:hypothetical protein
MLHNPTRSNGQAVVNTLTGEALRRLLHGKSAKGRAWLAANLIAHKVSFSDLSQAQVARLVRVNSGNVSRALGRAGRRGAQQRTLDHLIRRYGTDTLMRALDRATAPSMQAAE